MMASDLTDSMMSCQKKLSEMQLIIMIFDGKTQKVSEYFSLVILT